MERLDFRQLYDELEVMRDYLDSLFQQIQESSPILLLPDSGELSRKLLPGVQDTLRIQIEESNDEIVIRVEKIPGDLSQDIAIDLIHPMALKIFCIPREWNLENTKEYTTREHHFEFISQIISLPVPVTSEGKHTSLRNGILTVHLKKPDEDPET